MPLTNETRGSIFNLLKKNLEKCVPPLVVSIDLASKSYELIGNKPVPYGYSKKIVPGMYFASLAQRKDSVVLYFFPAYMNSKLTDLAPILCKCLKGKTCFHFKKEEQVNEKELSLLLKAGVDAWKKAGYMK
jgi:hypothetical protein